MTFFEIKEKLEYRELCFGFKYAFHGCLADSAVIIRKSGIKTMRFEPSVTMNVASALLKYANPALNSNNIYNGGLNKQILSLVESKAINPMPEESLYNRAMNYWRNDFSSGAAFVIDTTSLNLHRSEAGEISVEQNRLKGEISKWIYCHVSPVETTISLDKIVGFLHPSNHWNVCFSAFHPLKQNKISDYKSENNPFLLTFSRPNTYTALQKSELAAELARSLTISFLFQEMRKLLLAVMQSKGYVIVKQKAQESETWIFYTPEIIIKHFLNLEYENREIESLKCNLLKQLIIFYEESGDL